MFARPRRPWDRTPPEDRDYFEVLGDGLVAYVPATSPGAPGSGGWSPPIGGAWVHVGPDGALRAFSGKAEVGQGTKTALSLIVAEELRVPLSAVTMVVGDTDLCPWDMGTFGSRSMPDAFPVARRAAAGARQALLELAASRQKVELGQLEASGGAIRVKGRADALSYGELVRGLRKVVRVDPQVPVTDPKEWRTAGGPAVDPHAEDVVTGRRVYVSDVQRPGMWYGAVLYPPRNGATLTRVEESEAPLEGGARIVREGSWVAAVAPSPRAARRALASLRPTWKFSHQPGESEIEDHLRTHPSPGEDWDTDEVTKGDVDGGLARAAVKVEATYRTAYIAHVPLETRAVTAEWDGPRLTVWVGTQTPFRSREYVAKHLDMSEDDVRVIVPYTGSGFGGKHVGSVALDAARLAKSAGRPVQVSFSRAEEFQQAYLRPMAIIDVRAGVSKDGRLTAWSFHNVNAGAAALRTPYSVPNLRETNTLSDSPLPQGPYRALAANANNFARECTMDDLASGLGIDPLAFREQNLEDERLLAVLHRVVDRIGWKARSRRRDRGTGIAVGFDKNGRVATGAEVEVDGEGRLRVTRLVTAFEAGTVVHPSNLQSQVEGAAVMALGGALFEAIHFDAGAITNASLKDYRVPRFSDLPEVEAILIDRKDVPAAGGGETPMIAVAPAIANAVFEATGVRLRSLPLVPEGKLPRHAPTTARA